MSKCAFGVLKPEQVLMLPASQMLTLLDGANPLALDRVSTSARA